ncbi:DNA replication and repair protein RecN [Malonomonas rubra DSM 5091]|uniref:DNA repair protein RecN n=1 Tax=Malonomonas rubra DSM 5091 TaxID=1122189 RepID=A0A1M6C0D8_MALRU|nr:DNA repair protein RecN [Malonomonas rubra]SHI54440.1 DNA replication and repair protein RecN [Malonomonas rubra DSM 5091]
MLTDLIVKNFAIIENLHVQFGAGFNVLTGETGAGKSIVIDAVNLLLGGRARGEVIRTGTDEATVEAIFDLVGESSVKDKLAEQGLENDDELLVRRIVSRSGKNRVFVNGSTVTLAQLRELTSKLVNIYGQHEHQNLQRIETHLPFLDDFAGLGPQLDEYRDALQNWQQLQQQLDSLNLAERERQQRLDMLTFQQQELAAAKLVVDEDQELEQERSLLQNAEKLTAATSGGYEVLYAGQQAVCSQLGLVADQLEALQGVDPQLADLSERVRSSLFNLEDVAAELRSYAEKLEFEPHRQEQVEERLALLTSLKRKYAPTIDELLSYQVDIETELATLSDVEGHRDQLLQRLSVAEQQVMTRGGELSKLRRQAAEKLSAAVERELADLAMPKAEFSLQLAALQTPSADGLERGEFYLAANPGEPAQPLAKIASGGELSRIMLALKRSAPEADGVRTLIFDEVDAGIGGEAATAVGEKIGRLAGQLQVLCVTHLPQVAAFADQHYQVAKQELDGRTSTRLQRLAADERVAEMARMLGGAHVSGSTLEHARELIARSQTAAKVAG